jgi:putative transposase
LETLLVKEMQRNHCLAQSISDAAWSSFVTKLTYKAEWLGKTILKIGQFEPSSEICNVCGYHSSNLTLKDREWSCPNCNTKHDRDINAALNIKKFSFQDQNLIGV